MPFVPAFHRQKKSAAIVGKIIAGFGELEFQLASCVGDVFAAHTIRTHQRIVIHRLECQTRALRTLFRANTAQAKIKLARVLIWDFVTGDPQLEGPYSEAIGAVELCRNIRNNYAHAHWAATDARGLWFVKLQESAESPSFEMKYRFVSNDLLREQEAYLAYAHELLQLLGYRITSKAGLIRYRAPAAPKRLRPPLIETPPGRRVPPR